LLNPPKKHFAPVTAGLKVELSLIRTADGNQKRRFEFAGASDFVAVRTLEAYEADASY
jgi:hypothetical protein